MEEKKLEVGEYWLSRPTHLKQVGDSEPKLVVATPENPVKVRLYTETYRPGKDGAEGKWEPLKTDKFLQRDQPKAPMDPHPGKGGKGPKPDAAKVYSEKKPAPIGG